MDDLTGNVYGRWTVLCAGERNSRGESTWICKCECGIIKNVRAYQLKSGRSRSCGCLRTKLNKDITGERFGKLIAIRPTDKRTNDGSVHWLCKCDCGNITIVNGRSLRCGLQVSCGCLRTERLDNIDRTKINHKKHGAYQGHSKRERLYGVWESIKQRCYNPNSKAYKYYGYRKIEMCDEWRRDYAAFRDWAIANGYDPNAKKYKCTIDRINNDGNYEPSNCRFVDMKEQGCNRRKRGTVFKNGGEV